MRRLAGRRPRAAFAMREGLAARLFDEAALARLRAVLDLAPGTRTALDPADPSLARIEVLVTGWGCPPITPEVLAAMPSLRAILHAAGTVKNHLSPEVWDRGIVVTSAAGMNALPVAEYTVAMILLAGKRVPDLARRYRYDAGPAADEDFDGIGNYRRRVGILGASTIGRRVVDLLAPLDLDVSVSDPTLAGDDPVLARARRVDLETLFRESEVVSVHVPLLPETVGLVGRQLLELLPRGATLINTARGKVVDQDALLAVARDGRVSAILDVTDPEPLPLDHPLRSVPGIVLTPHVAGALGNELLRLGASVVDDAERLVAGETPRHVVPFGGLASMA